jgi:hypothetical protein
VNVGSEREGLSWALVQIDLDGYEDKAGRLTKMPEIDVASVGTVLASGRGFEPPAEVIAEITSGTITDAEILTILRELMPTPLKVGAAIGMPLMLMGCTLVSAVLLWLAGLIFGPITFFSSRMLVVAHVLICGVFVLAGTTAFRNSLTLAFGPANPFAFTPSRLLNALVNALVDPLRRLFQARFALGMLFGMLGNGVLWHFKPWLFLNAYEAGIEQNLRRIHPFLRRKARRKGGPLAPDPDILIRSMSREYATSSLLLLPVSAIIFALAQGSLEPPTIFLTYIMYVSIIGLIMLYVSWLVGAQALFLVQSASDRPVVSFAVLAASHMALLLILKLWADHAGGIDLSLGLVWDTAAAMFSAQSGLCLVTFSCGSTPQWLASLAILLFYAAVVTNLYAGLTGRESDAARINKAGLSILTGDLARAEQILLSAKEQFSETTLQALVGLKLRKGEIDEAWQRHDALLDLNGSRFSLDTRIFALAMNAIPTSDVESRIRLYKFCCTQGASDWSLINTIETVELMNGSSKAELIKIYLSMEEYCTGQHLAYDFTLLSGGLSLNALTGTQLFYNPRLQTPARQLQGEAFRARAHLYAPEAGPEFNAAPLLDAFARAGRPESVYCLAYLLNTLQTCQIAEIPWDSKLVSALLPLFEAFDREPQAETGEDLMVLTREKLSEAMGDHVAKLTLRRD